MFNNSVSHFSLNWLANYFEIVVRISLQPLAVVDETGEDDDAQHQEEDEQRQFFGRRFERVDEDLEAGRVARQFEQPQDADDGEKFQNVRIVDVMSQFLPDINLH